MYKKDLALNDLQWLICHKIKPKQPKQTNMQSKTIKNITIYFPK